MFPEANALERLAGDVAREVIHDHDVGHTLELAGHPGVDPLHEPPRRVLDRNLLDVPRLDVHASPR